MYHLLYNLGIWGYRQAIALAGPFNAKARSWVKGRKNSWQKLEGEINRSIPLVWVHAASLGEAEQAVPIMKGIRENYPSHRILLSFFSPSGMENFNRPDLTDHVCYLPIDTPGNASRFIDLIKPKLALFIKYEIWANYFLELQKRDIPVMIAPAVFRPDQFYFKKPHSNFFLPVLRDTKAILTQDEDSVELLNANGIRNCKKVGDSRFERVKLNAREDFNDSTLEAFSKNASVLICGSTWSPDEDLLIALARELPDLKMIIAPHDISSGNIRRVQRSFGEDKCFLYSQPPGDAAKHRYVIIDNIGMLSKIYRLGQIAYIGGGFGSGIHNSLEAVVYGMPVFFGPKHTNFIEPSAMIKRGFGHEIRSSEDLITGVKNLLKNPNQLKSQAQHALNYIEEGTGATDRILQEIKRLLN